MYVMIDRETRDGDNGIRKEIDAADAHDGYPYRGEIERIIEREELVSEHEKEMDQRHVEGRLFHLGQPGEESVVVVDYVWHLFNKV